MDLPMSPRTKESRDTKPMRVDTHVYSDRAHKQLEALSDDCESDVSDD